MFDMTDPFCTLVLRGIENSLYQASYLPILTDVLTSAPGSSAIWRCCWTGG